MLEIKGIKNLILCGVTTDVCVFSTMRDANDNKFDCVVVSDCTAAAEPHLHTGALESIKAEGGIFGAVTTSKDIFVALANMPSESSGPVFQRTNWPAAMFKDSYQRRPSPSPSDISD